MQTVSAPKIFVVDSGPHFLQFYERSIRRYGYANVYCFLRNEDCLAFMNLQPDVIFMDDLDALRKVKSMDPEVIVYFVCTANSMHNAALSLKFGATNYIVKNLKSTIPEQSVA